MEALSEFVYFNLLCRDCWWGICSDAPNIEPQALKSKAKDDKSAHLKHLLKGNSR